jgi:origin recognition complex subunit 1
MFIAGAPGVGKTACVRAVVRELKEEQAKGSIPEFDFISLNGMEMRYPFEAYAQLWEKLNAGDKTQCSPEQAVKKLETYFTNQTAVEAKTAHKGKKEHVVVLLLDEIDYLLTKTQSVLYHFFDWPRRACHNRLIVIGVSNTVNLPERLQSKVQSRIGSCRCSFKAYNSKEIVAILESKIQQASLHQKVFDNDAILFVSKKTASMSGDIRKAFNICRSAAELVMTESTSSSATSENDESQQALLSRNQEPIVRIKDVSRVSRESFNSPQSHAVTMCTPYEALLLLSLASLSKTTGREVGGFDVEELLVKMESIANSSGDRQYLPAPSLSETLNILARLGEAQLVFMVTPRGSSIGYRSCIAGSGGPWPVVSLMIDNVALLLALKSTPHKDLAEKHLSI